MNYAHSCVRWTAEAEIDVAATQSQKADTSDPEQEKLTILVPSETSVYADFS